MSKSKIVLMIAIIASVVGIGCGVYCIFMTNNNSYQSFVSSGDDAYSSSTPTEWQPTGLDIEQTVDKNDSVLNAFGLDISNMSEKDFYYDGSCWTSVVISENGIPYEVTIHESGNITVSDIETDSIPEEGSE